MAFSIAWLGAGVEPQPEGSGAWGWLAGFRQELHRCFTARLRPAPVVAKVSTGHHPRLGTELAAAQHLTACGAPVVAPPARYPSWCTGPAV